MSGVYVRHRPGLAAAIGVGVRDIVLGLGGSATTDGGTGLLTRARRTLPRRAGS